ncbi:transcription intermediary factor 1-beta-like [Saccostrea echinata]|uniref:transcription intermediary factor 1-beta-like n=1 Tax=Saccostrea echinata TaxID=191078 RepID=UPI002A7FDB7B|nr:transcription intermediary factor 1-beta-like [Saccostrea echinata]
MYGTNLILGSKVTKGTTAQDVIYCDLCSRKRIKYTVELVCKTCDLNLCRSCVGHHVSSDPSILHDITGYKFKKELGHIRYACCNLHEHKQCELRCKNCQISVCSKCVTSKHHADHELEKISDICEEIKSCLEKENKEYKRYISLTYDKIISDLQSSLDIQKKSYEKIREDIKKQGQKLHSEVDNSIKTLLDPADEMEKGDTAALDSSLMDMIIHCALIQLTVEKNKKKMENDNDAASLMKFSSKMSDCLRIPSLAEVSTPSFIPKEVKSDDLMNMCGTLIPSTKTERESYLIEIPKEEVENQ